MPRRTHFGNIWMAKCGFGGTEYLLPALVSEGTRRGMSYNHMAARHQLESRRSASA